MSSKPKPVSIKFVNVRVHSFNQKYLSLLMNQHKNTNMNQYRNTNLNRTKSQS